MPGTKFTKAEMASMRRAARDEAGVISEFWNRIKTLGRKLPFAESMVAAAYCASDPATPTRVKALIVGALAYFVMPFDGIPDILPMLGFTDDAAVIAATIAAIRAHMSEVHWEKAREFLSSDKDA
ncbi:MAG: YkvA family protein [Beijerinckiaceae bacterium]